MVADKIYRYWQFRDVVNEFLKKHLSPAPLYSDWSGYFVSNRYTYDTVFISIRVDVYEDKTIYHMRIILKNSYSRKSVSEEFYCYDTLYIGLREINKIDFEFNGVSGGYIETKFTYIKADYSYEYPIAGINIIV